MSTVDRLRRLEILDFQVFLCAAEQGSLRKASRQLDMNQSAVSRRVQRLENLMGVSLFERRPTGVGLTDAGWRFARHARSIVGDFDCAANLTQAAGIGKNGRLSIGLIASLSHGMLRELVAAYAVERPCVEIRFCEGERGELLTCLSHRRIDIVFASGSFPSEQGDSFVASSERVFLAISGKHPLAERERLSWDDVKDTRFLVSTDEPGPEIRDYIIQRMAELGRPSSIIRHKLGREGIMNLVGLGFGVSLVADHWRGVRYPNVAFLPIGDEDERVQFSLVWRPENDNPALRRFVSLARVHARKAAAGDAASQRPDLSP